MLIDAPTAARHPSSSKPRSSSRTAAGKISADLQDRRCQTFPDRQKGSVTTDMSKQIGRRHPDLQNISLRFGGVKALTDISFNVREHEIRAIIGPNGAGKSSMSNVINGVYHPRKARSSFAAPSGKKMEPHGGPPEYRRTFQNIALFKGMTVLDNIATGCNQDEGQFPARPVVSGWPRRRSWHREGRGSHRPPSKSSTSARPGGPPPYGLQKGRTGPRAWRRAVRSRFWTSPMGA